MQYTKMTVLGLFAFGIMFAQVPSALAQSDVVVERVNFINLRSGSEESRVSALKEILRTIPASVSEGCVNLSTANMKYGPTTEGCVKAFQMMRGLPQTGVVDEATNRALNAELAKGISSMPIANSMAVMPSPSRTNLAGASNAVTIESLKALLLSLQKQLQDLKR